MKKIIVAGGGPAGMMAAVKAAEQGAQVTLLEKMEHVGRKMRITGKGRCNITNSAEIPDIIRNIPGNGSFLHSALRAFDNRQVMQFFEDTGVPVKVERGGRVFPASDNAADVVAAMEARLRALGVTIQCKAPVQHVVVENGRACGVVLRSGERLSCDAVILAVGGASYPGTGSTGDGAVMAEALGHQIVPLRPALVPLETEETWPQALSGLSLRNVRVQLLIDGTPKENVFGEMLFTHFGVSGPLILTLSRKVALALDTNALVELNINLKPALTSEQLDQRVQREFAGNPKKEIKNILHVLMPSSLIPVLLDLAYLSPEKPVHQITKAERRRFVEALQNIPLTITKTRPLAEAIVTAGGVMVKEIHPKTLASRIVPGLYMAGEMVDIDGYTGGYNLQAAFSMGAAAGYWSACEE